MATLNDERHIPEYFGVRSSGFSLLPARVEAIMRIAGSLRGVVDFVELDGTLPDDGIEPQGLTGEHRVLINSTDSSIG